MNMTTGVIAGLWKASHIRDKCDIIRDVSLNYLIHHHSDSSMLHSPDMWSVWFQGGWDPDLALTDFDNLDIKFSKWFLAHNHWERVLDIVQHECAHVLAGYEAGHGDEWKRWCDVLGANPEQFPSNVRLGNFRFTG